MAGVIGNRNRMSAAEAKWRVFAECYMRTGNVTQSALKAGYTRAAAASTGSKLLKKAFVQQFLEQKLIDRKIHADETYRQIIEHAESTTRARLRIEAVIAENQKAIDEKGKPRPIYSGDLEMDLARAHSVEGVAWERLAKMEGLLIERPVEGDPRKLALTLQRLCVAASKRKLAGENGNGNGNGHALPAPKTIDAEARVVDTPSSVSPSLQSGSAELVIPPAPDGGKNGNGNHGPDWKSLEEGGEPLHPSS